MRPEGASLEARFTPHAPEQIPPSWVAQLLLYLYDGRVLGTGDKFPREKDLYNTSPGNSQWDCMLSKFFLMSNTTPACFGFSFTPQLNNLHLRPHSFLCPSRTKGFPVPVSLTTLTPHIFLHPNFLSPLPIKIFQSHLDDCRSCFTGPRNPFPSLHRNERIIIVTVQQVPKN